MKSHLQTLFRRSTDRPEEDTMDEDLDQKKHTDREKLEEIKSHVDLCPIGWFKGSLMKNFSASDEDVIKWLQHLFYITGSKKA